MASTYSTVYRYDNYYHRIIGRMESVPILTPTNKWLPTYNSTPDCFDCNAWKGCCSDTCLGCIKLIVPLVIPTAICTGQFMIVSHNIHSEAIVISTNVLAVALSTVNLVGTCYFFCVRGEKPRSTMGTLIPGFAGLGLIISSTVLFSAL
ncbi:MAG: hypothetical protein K1000chlam3_00234 [Chlamydiae bacterium]|nr:hypothetical protein [Chlamydiota bacterium]